MRQITFVTGNKYKFEVAKKVLENAEIELTQKKVPVPEIQSTDVVEIAKYAAKFAAKKLNKPVALTDAGWYIPSLAGFPGPFIKYINEWLTSEDLLRLMQGKTDRRVIIKACLAYCEPGRKPIVFPSEITGTIAQKSVKTNKKGTTSINEIFIPNGHEQVESEIPREEMIKFWAGVETYWTKLVDYLEKNKVR